jgi:hypothetical protein
MKLVGLLVVGFLARQVCCLPLDLGLRNLVLTPAFDDLHCNDGLLGINYKFEQGIPMLETPSNSTEHSQIVETYFSLIREDIQGAILAAPTEEGRIARNALNNPQQPLNNIISNCTRVLLRSLEDGYSDMELGERLSKAAQQPVDLKRRSIRAGQTIFFDTTCRRRDGIDFQQQRNFVLSMLKNRTISHPITENNRGVYTDGNTAMVFYRRRFGPTQVTQEQLALIALGAETHCWPNGALTRGKYSSMAALRDGRLKAYIISADKVDDY